MKPIAVISGVRTPFAKAFGELSGVSAVDLGVLTVKESLRRAEIGSDAIDQVILGNVAGPADSANIARVIALKSGVPQDRIAHTVNRNCASGMESILEGCGLIASGHARTIIAGGTESMSQIPMLYSRDAAAAWMRVARAKTIPQKLKAFSSFRPKHFKPVAGVELGLTDPVSGLNMGETAEVLAKEFAITRLDQDKFALDSHMKAEAAQERCFLSGEIVSVPIPGGGSLDKDNCLRKGQTTEQLAKLRPIFDRTGSVTAGNSCPLTDGAAAVVLAALDDCDRFGVAPLGWITASAIAGCDPRRMGLGPVYAIAKLLRQSGMSLDDFDLIEINEAFAAQVIACERALKSKSFAESELGIQNAIGELDRAKLNVHGGAIALGHPVGTTGTRLIVTLMRGLKAAGKKRGLASLCVGGGQGVAIAVEVTS